MPWTRQSLRKENVTPKVWEDYLAKRRLYMSKYRKENYERYKLTQRTATKKHRHKKQVEVAGRLKPSACEICFKQTKLVFDHSHNTGQFRGWICNPCNKALGFAFDDPNILRKLADYLEVYHSVDKAAS